MEYKLGMADGPMDRLVYTDVVKTEPPTPGSLTPFPGPSL